MQLCRLSRKITYVPLLTCLPPVLAGGTSLEEAFQNVALAMFNYMTVRSSSASLPALGAWIGTNHVVSSLAAAGGHHRG